MATIQRKFLAHFINTAKSGSAQYQRLGKDLETFSPELAAQVQTKKNILGQTDIVISGYEKTAQVETYYAEAGSALFDRLQAIIDDKLVLEDLKTDVVEVKLWDSDADTFPAVREEAYIEVVSYGGDTTGYNIPFKLHYTGVSAKGTFNIETNTFTAQ